jgi:hypothetical protein
MNTLEMAQKDPVVNKNINDPNKKIIVRLVSNGDLVAIDRAKDFKPGYHQHLKPATAKVVAPVEAPVSLDKSAEKSYSEEEAELWAALKEKTWAKLDGEERKVYSALKPKFV